VDPRDVADGMLLSTGILHAAIVAQFEPAIEELGQIGFKPA